MATPDAAALKETIAPLIFGETQLERLAPGAYRRTLWLENPIHAGRELDGYLPLGLTGILELALLSRTEPILPSELLFLDTETTGLSRGAGDYPFLTGLGYFEGEVLVIEQLFLAEPMGEEAYLERLDHLVRRFPYMVTYNGKSFDLPLLRTRWIMNRMKAGSPVLHFDLLHILKRMFPKGTSAGYKQKDMESALLQMERTDDIAGAEIPQIYFDYCKYGQDRGMEQIFRHNTLDVLGLVFLFLEAVRVYEQKDLTSPGLRSGIARILARNRRTEEAVVMLREITSQAAFTEPVQAETSRAGTPTRSVDPKERGRLDLLFLAGLYRARGDWWRARETYGLAAERHDCALARLALAKIYEHRHIDLPAALAEVLRLEERFHGAAATELARTRLFSREELAHRRKRLERKLALAERSPG